MSATVVLSPPPISVQATLMSAEEFAQLHEGNYCELVDGVVKELPMLGANHGKVCARMTALLVIHSDAHGLGHVLSNDSFFLIRRHPDTVRGADVAYCSYDRLPRGPLPRGVLPVAPDLVVEVRSPSDTWTEMYTKVGEYLGAGVRVVIILDADSETASIYRGEVKQETFSATDELTIPDVLPGFAVRVGQLFA